MVNERLELFKEHYKHQNIRLTKNDIGVIVGYFCLVILIGIFVSSYYMYYWILDYRTKTCSWYIYNTGALTVNIEFM